MNIIKHFFPKEQYYPIKTKKKGVVLHHTVSGIGAEGDINWWKETPSHVGTPIIITRDGKIHRLFSTKYWIHHLGIKRWQFKHFGLKSQNKFLNQSFIGIELDSWGGLVKRSDGNYYNSVGGKVCSDKVVKYSKSYRGYKYYEKYTEKQLTSLKEFLLYLQDYYSLDLKYKGEIMFEFNSRALSGEEGLWSHTSFRPDKSDVHPQEELINILKSI